MSVSMKHVSVLLRVTLLRRLAELSFRGIAFTELPREVVREDSHFSIQTNWVVHTMS